MSFKNVDNDLDRAPEGHQKVTTRKKSRIGKSSNKNTALQKVQLVHKSKTSRDYVAKDAQHAQQRGQEKVPHERKQKISSKGANRRNKKSQEARKAFRTEPTQPTLAQDLRNPK